MGGRSPPKELASCLKGLSISDLSDVWAVCGHVQHCVLIGVVLATFIGATACLKPFQRWYMKDFRLCLGQLCRPFRVLWSVINSLSDQGSIHYMLLNFQLWCSSSNFHSSFEHTGQPVFYTDSMLVYLFGAWFYLM